MQITLTLTSEFFAIARPGQVVRVAIEGPRQNALANAILMLPRLITKLSELGVREIRLPASTDPARVSAAHFALLCAKADSELEAARQEALEIAKQHGVTILSDDRVIGLDDLPDAFGKARTTQSGAFAD